MTLPQGSMFLQVAILTCVLTSMRTFRMEASAPVNPIEEDGILSLHCQVWDLPKSYEVRLHRTLPSGDTIKISVDETVLAEDERFFLAKRQLDGTSFVYFMSLMDVTRIDGGDYTCKVYNTTSGEMKLIGSKTIHIEIMYFPSDMDPFCSSNIDDNLVVDTGTEISMTCASDKANPIIELQWSRSGTDEIYDMQQHVEGLKVYSELKLTLHREHNGAVFWCTITSKVFPDEMATCHIGPITVYSSPKDIKPESDTPDLSNADQNLGTQNNVIRHPNSGKDTGISTLPSSKSEDCRTFCSSSSSVVFHWIFATVTVAGFALLFFLIATALFIRYNSARTTWSQYVPSQTPDDIYSDLEGKMQTDNSSYMYLHYTKPMGRELQIRESGARKYDGNQNFGKN